MNKKEKSKIADCIAFLNFALGVLDAMEEYKFIIELDDCKKFFPKGGIKLFRDEVIRAYAKLDQMYIKARKEK